jgi:hypothetical protein
MQYERKFRLCASGSGFEVINPSTAAIMTDPDLIDRTHIEVKLRAKSLVLNKCSSRSQAPRLHDGSNSNYERREFGD